MSDPPTERPPLDAARLRTATDHGPGGLDVVVVESTASTNALVAERARAGAPEGLVVVAEHQTSGRGRLDRRWEAPPRAALTFSVLLRPTVPATSWPWLPLLTGYAVATVLRAGDWEAGLKWPNDVLIGDRKVAGILVERLKMTSDPVAVVGIGLNVGMTADELPVQTATSLAVEGADRASQVPDRTDLLLSLVTTLLEEYDAWQAGGDAAATQLAASYASMCVSVGRDVRVELPSNRSLQGRAVGVDRDGRLLVDTEAGREAVGAGDVIHVR